MCCPRAPGRDPRRSTRSVYVLWRRAQPLDVVRSPNSRNVTWYGRRRYSRTLTSGARAPITSNSHPVASASCVPSPLVSQVGSAEPRSRLALHLRHRADNLVCRLVHPESALQVLQSVQVRGRAEWGLPQTPPSVSQPPQPPWVATRVHTGLTRGRTRLRRSHRSSAAMSSFCGRPLRPGRPPRWSCRLDVAGCRSAGRGSPRSPSVLIRVRRQRSTDCSSRAALREVRMVGTARRALVGSCPCTARPVRPVSEWIFGPRSAVSCRFIEHAGRKIQ